MTATDELRRMLDERGVEWESDGSGFRVMWGQPVPIDQMQFKAVDNALPNGGLNISICGFSPEQAIAATLGFPKAKAHPYGYEPDTGAFDATRCECGCVNDISATYCNDCGGEIEIDMNAEKEIYHCPRHLVFAEKHDDGSLEFCGERYIAATLGHSLNNQSMSESLSERGTCHNTDEDPGWFECSECGCTCSVDWWGAGLGIPNFCPQCGRKVEG